MYSQAEPLHHAFSGFGWSWTAVTETFNLTGQGVAARENINNKSHETLPNDVLSGFRSCVFSEREKKKRKSKEKGRVGELTEEKQQVQ